ncbi:hypothetical protein [Pseudomonas viridiflava]|uniref:hypothetical protein n=1 Tax=Pseudomonas viridiflava TaxID=33069 RepID=UPI0013CE5298|nr:hypothetical protein [Pseudomonas viridiflava]
MNDDDEIIEELSSQISRSRVALSGLVSESLNFEDFIITSSKRSGSFSREWVEAEVEKSGEYFTRHIFGDS